MDRYITKTPRPGSSGSVETDRETSKPPKSLAQKIFQKKEGDPDKVIF